MRTSAISLFIVFLITVSSTAQVYELNKKQELSLLGLGAGFFTGAYFLDQNQTRLNLPAINGLNEDDVFILDRWALGNYSPASANASDWFRNGAYLLPLSLGFTKQVKNEWKAIGLMYLETWLINESFTSLIKSGAGRVRPYAYNTDVSISLKLDPTTKRSFFSGHVSHVTSLSFFTASVFSDLYPTSDYKWIIWSAASLLPAATAYLRYDAGRHYPTDVLFGFLSGATIGMLIPKLHKKKIKDLSISLIPHSNSLVLSSKFEF